MQKDVFIIENPVVNDEVTNHLIQLLYVKDNSNEIINKIVTLDNYEEAFNKLFDLIRDQSNEENVTWKKVLNNSNYKKISLSIFKVSEILQKGWVYNSKTITEEKVYELSLIKLNNEMGNVLKEKKIQFKAFIDREVDAVPQKGELAIQTGDAVPQKGELAIQTDDVSNNENEEYILENKCKCKCERDSPFKLPNIELSPFAPTSASTSDILPPPYSNPLYYDDNLQYTKQYVCKYPTLYEDPFPDIPYMSLYDYTQNNNQVKYSENPINGYGDNPFDLTSSIANKQKKSLHHRQKAVYHDANSYDAVTLELKQQLVKPNFGLRQTQNKNKYNNNQNLDINDNQFQNLSTCTISFDNYNFQ